MTVARYPKSFANLRNFQRVADELATRKHRILDERDVAMLEAMLGIEEHSDSVYPAVTKFSSELNNLVPDLWYTGMSINGTNFVADTQKATGTSTRSAGAITFTAVVPGEQTIVVSLVNDGSAISVTANAGAGTIVIQHNGDTAADIANAVNINAVGHFMVDATVATAGVITVNEDVTVETTVASPGVIPVLQIGDVPVEGANTRTGISSWTDTAITFDFMVPSTWTQGSIQVMRLWVDGVLVLETPLVVTTVVSRTAEVTLAPADMLALDSTPIEVVAAPGFGRYLKFKYAELVRAGDVLGVAYTVPGVDNDFTFSYTDAAGPVVAQTVEATNFLDAAIVTKEYRLCEPVNDVAGPVENAAIVVWMAGAAPLTDGTVDVAVRVHYDILPVLL